jgi:hypothetical protein
MPHSGILDHAALPRPLDALRHSDGIWNTKACGPPDHHARYHKAGPICGGRYLTTNIW